MSDTLIDDSDSLDEGDDDGDEDDSDYTDDWDSDIDEDFSDPYGVFGSDDNSNLDDLGDPTGSLSADEQDDPSSQASPNLSDSDQNVALATDAGTNQSPAILSTATQGTYWPSWTLAAGLSAQGSMILPVLSRGGGIAGLNLELFISVDAIYITSSWKDSPLGIVMSYIAPFGLAMPYVSDLGFGLYQYHTPSEDSSTIGFSVGDSFTGNVAIGSGPYTGIFYSYEQNLGPVDFGGFTSDLNFNSPYFVGITGGLSSGAPLGSATTVADYTALFEFRLGAAVAKLVDVANTLDTLQVYLNFALDPLAFPGN